MRLVIIDCAVTVGGTTVVTSEVESLMRAHGHEVLVVTTLTSEQTAGVFDKRARLVSLKQAVTYDDVRLLKEIIHDRSQPAVKRLRAYLRNRFSYFLNLGYIIKLAWKIRRFNADVVHYNNGWEPPFSAKLAGVPSLHQMHGLFANLSARFARFSRFTLRLPKQFWAISTCVAQSAVEAGLPEDRINLIPNFLTPRAAMPATEAARERLGIARDRPVVAIVGRVVRWKGQLEAVRIMAEVVREVPDALLLVAGSHSDGELAYYNSVVSAAREAGIAGNVLFAGHLADPYLAYRAADVVIHTSIEPEPFGMVLIEAMEAGTPLVAASSGGPLDIIRDGQDGFLADPNDAVAFARPVVELLTQPARAAAIVAAATRRFEETYAAEAVYPKLLALYEKTKAR